jgi:hypothetical protein
MLVTSSSSLATAFLGLGNDYVFSGGRDKLLNQTVASAIATLLSASGREVEGLHFATSLGFVQLIPDIAVLADGEVLCLECTWRSCDILARNRSDVAQYMLTKLRGYAVALGWEPTPAQA